MKTLWLQWGTTEPEFNEQFVFMTNIVDLPKQSLAVTVWHHDKHKQNDYLGKQALISFIMDPCLPMC